MDVSREQSNIRLQTIIFAALYIDGSPQEIFTKYIQIQQEPNYSFVLSHYAEWTNDDILRNAGHLPQRSVPCGEGHRSWQPIGFKIETDPSQGPIS